MAPLSAESRDKERTQSWARDDEEPGVKLGDASIRLLPEKWSTSATPKAKGKGRPLANRLAERRTEAENATDSSSDGEKRAPSVIVDGAD
ncbi:unnamed protein product [Heligmosomoides polygyrus]|uniref:Uncharacterized protein n=1 Tax=Heligmosomoides polygyrus TaxID=6339 RepID=A0A183FFD0_HELPZ|nr:unnamed protein product [Heligmosomoides polygyrus]